MAEWFDSGANVRQMHSVNIPPAGLGIALESAPDGEFVRTKVVEPSAVRLVDEGVYRGYSVGISRPRIIRDGKAPGGRIVGGKIVELSLVDRPANPMAKFALVKVMGGVASWVGDQIASPPRQVPKAVPPSEASPRLAERLAAEMSKGNLTHDHAHHHSDGTFHSHDHAHPPTTVPHSDTFGGAPHSHGHASTEVSVPVNEQDQPGQDQNAAPVTKGDGAMCPKCGTSLDAENKCKSHGFIPFGSKAAAPPAADDGDDDSQDGKPGSGTDTTAPDDDQAADDSGRNDPDADAVGPSRPAKGKARKFAKVLKRAAAPGADGVPFAIRRLHDATCAAYKGADVLAEYPALAKGGSEAISPAARQVVYDSLLRELSADGGAGTAAAGITALGKAYGDLAALLAAKTADAALTSAQDELHGLFKSINSLGSDAEGGSLPKPSGDAVQPGSYRRPYISAGHQSETPVSGGPSLPSSGAATSADQFDRGPLTDGHQRYLTEKVAGLHDAISEWRPTLCLMDALGSYGADRQPQLPSPTSLDNQAGNGLHETTPTPDPKKVPGEKAAKAKTAKIAKPKTTKAVTDGSGLGADVIKAALAAALEPMTKELSDARRDLAASKAELDRYMAAPDPRREPVRGVPTIRKTVTSDQEAQREAARTQRRTEKVEFLKDLATNASSVADRLAARTRLQKLGVDL